MRIVLIITNCFPLNIWAYILTAKVQLLKLKEEDTIRQMVVRYVRQHVIEHSAYACKEAHLNLPGESGG